MKKITLFLFAFIMLTTSLLNAQTDKSKWILEQANPADNIYMISEDEPTFPGGETELINFMGENLNYPLSAKDEKIDGLCVVSFIIEKDGSISNAKVSRDIGGGCGEEALKMVKMMPNWTPGKENGQTVRVSYNLPVRFSL